MFRILFVSKRDRKTILAALISAAERAEEASNEEADYGDPMDALSLANEAHNMKRLSHRFR